MPNIKEQATAIIKKALKAQYKNKSSLKVAVNTVMGALEPHLTNPSEHTNQSLFTKEKKPTRLAVQMAADIFLSRNNRSFIASDCRMVMEYCGQTLYRYGQALYPPSETAGRQSPATSIDSTSSIYSVSATGQESEQDALDGDLIFSMD